MKKVVKSILFCLLASLIMVNPVFALSDGVLDRFSANNIMFYDPDECGDKTKSDSSEVTAASGGYERLKEAIEAYHEKAMAMQVEWGTPWDVVFAQMQIESQVGTAGVAVSGADNNWLGITGTGDAGKYGRFAIFSSVEASIEAWSGTHVLRNGYYDDAFPYLNTENWDMHSFLVTMISHYAPSSDGNDEETYVSNIESLLNGPIKEKQEEMGLPNSFTYAKNENIPVGGKHPLDGSSTGTTGVTGSSVTADCPDENATIDGTYLAKKAVGMAWPVQEDGTCETSSGTSVSWSTNASDCYPNPRDLYQENYDKYNMSGSLLDCGHFIATVVHSAEVDEDFPKSGTTNQGTHLAGSSKWEKVSASSESDLKPGDIMWYDGHIEMYVGEYGGEYGKIASASQDDYVGIIKAFRIQRKGETATVYRLIPQSAGLKSGGMTLSEAETFMEAYAAESDKFATGPQTFQGATVTDSGCPDGTLNNCSAFTQWFLNRYTDFGPSGAIIHQGSQAVSNYLSENSGLENGGKVPKAYAIMSQGPMTGNAGGWGNHTGIVLGIDTDNDQIIIGEASCGMSRGERSYRPGAHVYSLSSYTNSDSAYGPTYAYTDNILKMNGN